MSSIATTRERAIQPSISRLPDELLSCILTFSGNLSVGRVCRRWNRPDFIRACYRAILESYSPYNLMFSESAVCRVQLSSLECDLSSVVSAIHRQLQLSKCN